MKTSFVFYTEYREYLELLSPEDVKNLMLIIMDYVEFEKEPKKPNLSDRLLMVWIGIKKRLDTDKVNYDKRCETSKRNGRLGGRPKKGEKMENLKNLTENLKKPKKADNEYDDDSDNDNDNDIKLFNELNNYDDEDNHPASISKKTIFEILEENFGYTIAPTILEKIKSWQEVFNDDILKYAIDICVKQNVRTFQYLEGILKSWQSKGYKKLIECQNEKKSNSKEPNWFDKKVQKQEATVEEKKQMEELLREYR